MLIKALCNYYDFLARNGKVIPNGYSRENISGLIELNPDGSIAGIADCRISDSSKEHKKPQKMLFPLRVETTKVESNLIEHRGKYIFGLVFDTKTKSLATGNMVMFQNFKEKNLKFFESIDSQLGHAFKNFLITWNPKNETGNEYLVGLGKNIGTFNFAFCLAGHPEELLQDDCAVLTAWESYYAKYIEEAKESAQYAQCAILGEEAPIARIHNKIKGLYGGNHTGNVLVSFNEPAFNSYGASQSYNSNISETAMLHYTEAMNYLISDPLHRTILNGITFLHWAEDDNDEYSSIFSHIFDFKDYADREKTDQILHEILNSVKNGIVSINEETICGLIDPNVRYYIVGIKPNAARISVEFICCQSFGTLLQNVFIHTMDMQLHSEMKPVPLGKIQKELASPKSSNKKVDSVLSARLMQSIILGSPYPANLLPAVIRRIKTDSDDEKRNYIKMNDTRMGLIKACINRQCRVKGTKEVIKMALDKENKEPAYICGRLFALLENIQQRSSGFKLNRTIRDTHFSRACSFPATTFPALLSLSQHHLSKLKDTGYSDREIQDLIEQMDGNFPQKLSLTDQGIFMFGYYHQKADISKRIKEYKEKEKRK